MNKHLFRYLLTAGLLATTSGAAWAIKANPKPITIKQPDGTTLVIRVHGDENFHYITTTDGFLIQRDKDGYFKYVQTDATQGTRRLTARRATNADKRSADDNSFVSTLRPIRREADAEWLKSLRGDIRPMTVDQTLPATVRSRKVNAQTGEAKESEYLVVLVKYADGEFHFTDSDFEAWLNEKGYSKNGGTGSVKDYYRDNSMGQFVPNFTVLGPYTLDHERTYYAADFGGTGNDVNPQALVIEAAQKAKADHPEIDFSKFDNDGDGYMDNINVIIGGYSQASSGDDKDMWPHSYRLKTDDKDLSIEIDGIRVNNYSVSAELVGASGVAMDGIGTFTHEFGHILGLKDMYDTDDYDGGIGIDPGAYSLYASGSYNNNSRTPAALMTFERIQMGWLDKSQLIKLDKPADVTLPLMTTNTAAYVDARPGLAEGEGYEWYVFENRQQTGWDSYIPYHGLLIYHLDYTQSMVNKYWSVNGPNNNARHRCMYIVPADGIDDTNTRKDDTYPGTTGTTEFTDYTNWLGDKVRTPITNIREEGGLIYMQVKGGVTEQSSILTQPIDFADITSNSVNVKAKLGKATQDISEMGFCWSDETEEPTLNPSDSKHKAVATANSIELNIDGLDEASLYYVRAYMTLADGSTVYGASLPVKTEHKTLQAPLSLTFDDTDFDGSLSYWRIVDENNDANTWAYDSSTQGMVYNADYWNEANDWLISEKMHVPERGGLYIMRGVMDPSYVEKLDVYVSTQSRNVSDFHLVKQFSLADQFGELAVDEVDLSDFAGKDVYVALVCSSERMQGSLWLWGIMLTQRLERPVITTFERQGDALHAEWNEVKNARKYYLEFYKETNEPNVTTKNLPESDITDAVGDVSLGTGTMRFTGSGTVQTIDYAGGISNIKYVLKSGGPRGTSTFGVEGSNDGVTWTRIGELLRISSVDADGTAVDLSAYMKNKSYQRLRMVCDFGGRLVNITNFSITYTDGVKLDTLAMGASGNNGTDTQITINATQPGEFNSGRYRFMVTAGDGLLYYDTSEPAIYEADPTGITNVTIDPTALVPARALCQDGIVRLAGLSTGKAVTLYATDGRQLLRFIPNATHVAVKVNGYEGIVLIKQDK